MTYPGALIAIGGLSLSSLTGVQGTVTAASDDPRLEADYIQRADAAPVYVTSTVAPLNLVVQLTNIQSYDDRRTILRALRYPQTDQTLTLRAYVGDPSSTTQAVIDVTVAAINAQPGSITVDCTAPGGLWRSYTATTIGPYDFKSDGAFAITSSGEAVTYATYKVGWATQRTTQTSTVGWKYRRQVTITNNTDRDWVNRPVCIDLGDTAAWVTAAKAQSDGDDVRIRLSYDGGNGKELYRTLVNFNTKRTFAWTCVSIKSGKSLTLDVVYGNSAATAPRNFSTRTGTRATYIAFDLEGDSGTATAGSSSTLTNSGESWETNRWRGGYIQLTGGTGSGQRRRIASNTGTVITVTRNFSSSPDNTTTYVIWRSGLAVDGGRATSGGTSTTLTDASQAWGTNQWAGGELWNITAGTGPFTIASNTATVITTTDSMSPSPALNDSYYIERYGVHTYSVDPAVYDPLHLDLWRRNTYYTKPSNIKFGNQTPGGWMPTLYLDNGDDFAQSRVFDIGTGGGHDENWRGTLRARRARSQDNTYPEEGQADGVSVYAPEGYQAMYYDFQIKNESGVGKFVVSVLDPGGEEWRDVRTYSTTQATLTAVAAAWRDLSSDDNPTRIYMGVLPADGVAIPTSVAITEEIEARTNERLELYLDVDGIGGLTNSSLAVGSETEIYDLNVTLRLGGGDEVSLTPPYDLLQIGGTNHHLHLAASQYLWITTDPETLRPFAGVYNSSDVLVYACPWAVRAYRYEADSEGTSTALVARQIMPIAPVTDLITNGSFTSGITGWTLTEPTGNVDWSHETTIYFDSSGSLQADLTTGNDVGRAVSTAFSTVPGETYTITLACKTDGTSIDELSYVGLKPYIVDDGGAGSATPLIDGIGYILNTVDIGGTTDWQVLGYEFTATDDSYALRIDVVNTLTSACTVYLDQITGGVPGVFVSETEMGELTVETEHYDRWLA